LDLFLSRVPRHGRHYCPLADRVVAVDTEFVRHRVGPELGWCSADGERELPTRVDSGFCLMIEQGSERKFIHKSTQDVCFQLQGEGRAQRLQPFRMGQLESVAFEPPCLPADCSARAKPFSRSDCDFGFPTVTCRPCLHNCLLSVLIRRGGERPVPRPDVYELFQIHFASFLAPLQAHLDTCPIPCDEELFEWWVSRPGVYAEVRREQLREARARYQAGDRKDMWTIKAFEKQEFSLKEDPKPRSISCFSDLFVVAFAPYVQYVAFLLAPCLEPGVYASLPGSPGYSVTWDKGFDPITHAELRPQPAYGFVCEEDGENWDRNHRIETLAQPRSLYVSIMPRETALEYALMPLRVFTKARIPVADGPDYVLMYAVAGSLNTGEPDTSLTNTLICAALDTFRRTWARPISLSCGQ
jgi:hypothetical protein